METKKIINLLYDSSNEESKFATKNGLLQTVKQLKTNATQKTQLNLRQKVSNQVFVINLMYLFQLQEI